MKGVANWDKSLLKISGFTLLIDKLNLLIEHKIEKNKSDKNITNIIKYPFFKYEILICSVGLNLLEAKLLFWYACQVNKVSAMIYSFKNENLPIDE